MHTFLCFVFQRPPVYLLVALCVKAAGISVIVAFISRTFNKMFQYAVFLVVLSGLICMIIHVKPSFSASVLEWYSGMCVHVPVLT